MHVDAVRVEDVDVVESEPAERLVEAREQIAAATELTIGTRPHVPTRLARDDEFVAVGLEVRAQHPAEVLLGGAVRRTVVVREVEVGDSAVKGMAQYFALGIEWPVVAEVVPQA
jgi:predicted thioesterase